MQEQVEAGVLSGVDLCAGDRQAVTEDLDRVGGQPAELLPAPRVQPPGGYRDAWSKRLVVLHGAVQGAGGHGTAILLQGIQEREQGAFIIHHSIHVFAGVHVLQLGGVD